MAVPEGTTKDGYEVQLGVNHLGHALLTKLLLPTMLKTAEKPDADVRIINLSSGAHARCPAPGIDYEDLTAAKMGPMGRYSRSKLANIYFTQQLAQRYPSIKSVAIHPGVVQTNLFDTMLSGSKALGALSSVFGWAVYVKVEDGAKNQLWAATAPKSEVESGTYYTPIGEKNKGSAFAQDAKAAAKLWDWTEAELKKHGY
jgi:NAD(P)-dependent dehydrogenase (short-subunit alcohol dehydrogenase family)